MQGETDRFIDPLYTMSETARYLDVPTSTLQRWARGVTPNSPERRRVQAEPLITSTGSKGSRSAVIPFVGLAEGYTLAAFRNAGVSVRRIRPAIEALIREFGFSHALASKNLYTDGADVLYDYASSEADDDVRTASRQLVVVRNGQHVFTEVVDRYLRLVEFGSDNYATLIHLPAYRFADVVVDPLHGFGQPRFSRGGARLQDALGMFEAGESLETVAAEYGVPREELEDAVRIAARAA